MNSGAGLGSPSSYSLPTRSFGSSARFACSFGPSSLGLTSPSGAIGVVTDDLVPINLCLGLGRQVLFQPAERLEHRAPRFAITKSIGE